MLLCVIADYGAGDLAFAEVRQRCALLLTEADLVAVRRDELRTRARAEFYDDLHDKREPLHGGPSVEQSRPPR
jgi:hypothetical protein